MNGITTIIENSPGVRGEIAHEHGLSLWIERGGRAVLFDTGAGDAFLKNARLLGIDLSRAEAVVVSHGHSDHSGGVRGLYSSMSARPPLATGPCFFDPKYETSGGGHHYLGPDFDVSWLASNDVEHRVVGDGKPGRVVELIPGVHAVSGFPRVHPEEIDNPAFVVDRGGAAGPEGLVVDDYRDEVCLVVESSRGLVVALGCAHPGAMNMLDQVRAFFGPRLRAVLGGTHLMAADEARTGTTLAYLRALGCERIGIAHCSGSRAAELLAGDPSYYAMRSGSALLG